MENSKFDEILKSKFETQLSSINMTQSQKQVLWNNLEPKVIKKATSISIPRVWMYAAASVVLLMSLGLSFMYFHFTGQMDTLLSEKKQLEKQLKSNYPLARSTNKIIVQTKTVVVNKEKIKTLTIQNTKYVHDTLKIVDHTAFKESVLSQVESKVKKDSIQVAVVQVKVTTANKKLHFTNGEDLSSESDPKFSIITSGSLAETRTDNAKVASVLKFTLN